MSKNFFSKKRAEEYAKMLEKNGAENVTVWSGKDGFGQDQYNVKWNYWTV